MYNKKCPKLSIIIPCFNKPDYLIEMLNCIMAQSFKNWELILVDDGSEETNYNKIKDFVTKDKRITLIKRNRLPKNGNTCRNIGMDLVQGKYLLLLDSDDLLSDTCFEERVSFMDNHPDCDYASFHSGTFNDGSKIIKLTTKNPSSINILGNILSTNYPFTVWSNIYRRTSLNSIRWDENLYIYQDFDFMVQCEMKGLKHYWTKSKKYDYYYRIFNNGNSVCSNFISDEKCNSTLYLIKKTLDSISDHPDCEELKEQFSFFIAYHIERILKGRRFEDVSKIAALMSKYYDTKKTIYLRTIINRCSLIKNDKFLNIYIHWSLYKMYKIPLFRSFLIHEIIKLIILIPLKK